MDTEQYLFIKIHLVIHTLGSVVDMYPIPSFNNLYCVSEFTVT